MVSQIKNKLEKEISNPTKIIRFNRNHIFYDLKSMIIDNSDKESLIDLYYCFSLYEKCLKLCQSNNLDLASYWFSKIDQVHSKLSNNILQYLQILYIPCLAFYHYKNENFKTAIELLSVEMNNADLLLKSNKSLKLEIKLEQLINKYRVFVTSKDYRNSISLANNIIDFVINSRNFDDIPNDDISCIKSENIENYLNWINFLIDNIIIKIQFHKHISDQEKERIYYNIFGNITCVENEEFVHLNNAFQAIKYYYEKNDEKFLKYTYVAFEEIYKLPINIQQVLLNFLIKREKLDSQLHEEYLARVLEIKQLTY
ncbi:hypothetical protein [Chryseobacterium rhizosphaerae]|uniref:hypothetical protein n=1 Tax=Chryseobacterium rhizosphaerae TaxID=395937 RepID=UPI00235942F7|nr:hypothetical protein [Chryseobacterium rhizosphaerae]MDC8099151.1 hypothetical protein [Chryseobacterium rhizosphaerae]